MARKGSQKTPELVLRLVDMGTARLIDAFALPEDDARRTMRAIAHDLCREYGGGPMYVPRDKEFKLTERDLDIWRAFDGDNVPALARQHQLTERQVRDILAHVKRQEMRRTQQALPGLEEAPAA